MLLMKSYYRGRYLGKQSNKNEGFTLIELLAVIVILAVIALISSPLIMGTITKAKKNAFRDTAYGILKAGEKYTAEMLLESENTYKGETISIPESSSSKKLNYKGQEPIGGQMLITREGDISVVIYNESWCAIKNADDKEVTVDKYDKVTCKLKEMPLAQIIINKNISGNTDGLFADDYGNTRYRGSNSEVKNYVNFNGESWRAIGVFDGKVKLLRETPTIVMEWNSSNWEKTPIKPYLNVTFYNALNEKAKSQIEESAFHLGGHDQTVGVYANDIYLKERGTSVYGSNPTSVIQNIGLMYPSDYAYAARSSCKQDLHNLNTDRNCVSDGNWMYKSDSVWTQTPSSNSASLIYYTGGLGNIALGYGTTIRVRPVLYLKANIISTGGDGSIGTPYLLK